jgi:hypothetical protein
MDIRMPVMDGYAAARAIRLLNRPDAASVPILAMSADVLADDVQRCLQSGMNGHIAKPIDPADPVPGDYPGGLRAPGGGRKRLKVCGGLSSGGGRRFFAGLGAAGADEKMAAGVLSPLRSS